MTNAEVIEKLKRLPSDHECTIWIRTYTQAYAVTHVTPFSVDAAGIWLQLPEGYAIHKQKDIDATRDKLSRLQFPDTTGQ